MFKSSIGAVGAAVLSLAAIATAPSASAAVVTGSWDPVLPAPFINLGWVSTVNMGIDDNCVVNRVGIGFFVKVFGTSFGCLRQPRNNDFTILRAQVGLYSTITGLIIDVLEFAPPSGPMGVDLTEPTVNNFVLNLGMSSAVSATAPGTFGFSFKLAVPGALPVLFYQDRGVSGTFIPATGTPILTRFDVQPNGSQATVLADTRLTIGQLVAPTAIHEPGSLALALLALGAAGAAASRRTGPAQHSV